MKDVKIKQGVKDFEPIKVEFTITSIEELETLVSRLNAGDHIINNCDQRHLSNGNESDILWDRIGVPLMQILDKLLEK